MLQNGPSSQRRSKKGDNKKKNKNGKLDLGDLLGRSKEGFQRVRTEEGDEEEEEDEDDLSSDSDEEFSVPALRA